MGPHVFGIRHHGPGSARSLLKALAPDADKMTSMDSPAPVQPARESPVYPYK